MSAKKKGFLERVHDIMNDKAKLFDLLTEDKGKPPTEDEIMHLGMTENIKRLPIEDTKETIEDTKEKMYLGVTEDMETLPGEQENRYLGVTEDMSTLSREQIAVYKTHAEALEAIFGTDDTSTEDISKSNKEEGLYALVENLKRVCPKAVEMIRATGGGRVSSELLQIAKYRTIGGVPIIEGDKIIGYEGGYRNLKELGVGGKGAVFLGEDGRVVKVSQTDEGIPELNFQIDIATKLSEKSECPTIVKIYESAENIRKTGFSFLVMENLDEDISAYHNKLKEKREELKEQSRQFKANKLKGSAERLERRIISDIRGIGDGRTARIGLDLVSAIEYCHEMGIYLGDINYYNLRFKDGTAKFYDFGSAFDIALLDDPKKLEGHTFSGTYHYLHKDYIKVADSLWGGFPEKVPSKTRISTVLRRRDYAAYAFTLYEALTGRQPYSDVDGKSFFDKHPSETKEDKYKIIKECEPIDYEALRKSDEKVDRTFFDEFATLSRIARKGDETFFFETIINACLNPMSFSKEYDLGKDIENAIMKKYYIHKVPGETNGFNMNGDSPGFDSNPYSNGNGKAN